MNPNDPNVSLLERAAEQLGEALLEQLVFVGGAVAGVLITDPAMPEIRPTQDVDVICRVIARADYHQLGRQLRQRGFQEDSGPGAPLCRWCTDDLILDLMPTQGEILGFSNRWYPLALETAQLQELPSGCAIRIVTAPRKGTRSWPPSWRPFAALARAIFSSVTTWRTSWPSSTDVPRCWMNAGSARLS